MAVGGGMLRIAEEYKSLYAASRIKEQLVKR